MVAGDGIWDFEPVKSTKRRWRARRCRRQAGPHLGAGARGRYRQVSPTIAMGGDIDQLTRAGGGRERRYADLLEIARQAEFAGEAMTVAAGAHGG
jgi:hypothetical protein